MRKRITLTGVCVSLLLAVAVPMAFGQQSSLKILSPKEGEAVPNNITLKWEFKKAGNADHVHSYLDGGNQGMWYGTSAELKGLSPGSHKIRIIAATKDHQEIEPEATVEVTVKGTAEAPKAAPARRGYYGY